MIVCHRDRMISRDYKNRIGTAPFSKSNVKGVTSHKNPQNPSGSYVTVPFGFESEVESKVETEVESEGWPKGLIMAGR